MTLKPMSFAHIMSIADAWRGLGGLPKVDLGALEPLLWRDGQYRIHDVVNALTQCGFEVSITTNGQLLDDFAENLSRAGISLIRTSWHSTNSLVFQEISGGYGDYNRFMRGLTLALDLGIKVAFNRVLIKGYIDDVAEQLPLIEKYRSRLKLYTLMWTPQNASSYEMFYQDWRPVVQTSVLPHTIGISRIRKQIGRERIQFHLAGGGLVEVKLAETLDRSQGPCASCPFKNECEEGFGDYVRVDPRLHLYFCYMRRDLGFPMQEYFARSEDLKRRLQDAVGEGNVKNLLATIPLRLTVSPFCNFNCRIPGAEQGWCMEAPSDYRFPRIRKSILVK